MHQRILAAAAAGLLVATPAVSDTIVTTYLPATTQAPTSVELINNADAVTGTFGFDTLPSGSGAHGAGATFSTEYGTAGVITGTYSGDFSINAADQYGGAGGTGKYIVTSDTTGYKVMLANSGAIPGVNYFGFWLSALDAGNEVVLRENGTQVGTYAPADLLAAVGSQPAYFGNPNADFLRRNNGQPYAFVNFFDTSGFFNEVDFTENPAQGGYESDNHVVGYRDPNVPFGASIVPEPVSVGLLGFGCVCAYAGVRRREA